MSNKPSIELPITLGYVTLIDAEDYERVNQFKWWANEKKHKDGSMKAVYVHREIARHRKILLHRFIMGITDRKVFVDHRNHNGLDNRKSNLRITDFKGNAHNQVLSRANTSGFKGVSKLPDGRFAARICSNSNGVKRTEYLGRFETPEAAARAYDAAAISRWGEFAHPNFPEASNV